MKKRKFEAVILLFMLALAGCSTNQKNATEQNSTKNQVTATPEVSQEDKNQVTEPATPTTDTSNQTQEYKVDQIVITDGAAALNRLKEGNLRFVNNESELINVTSERRNQLLDGQNPYAVVVSCSDSRVTPTTVFNAGLGEIFDIRIAGNVVDSDALGSIEYGVDHLKAPLLVIMGHEKCGAVTAAYDELTTGAKAGGKIQSIVDKILPAINDSENLDEAIRENIDEVTDQVEADEMVEELVQAGKLKIVKAYYSLDGTVTFEEE